MYALVTTHRSVIMSVVTGPDVATLKAHLRMSLGASMPPLSWTNYRSHWGVGTTDGLTTHTIHAVSEAL